MTSEKSNNIFLGILIGVGVSIFIGWYFKDNKNPTWWCEYLPSGQAVSCRGLYDKAVEKMQSIPNDNQQCTPDYMGGCN